MKKTNDYIIIDDKTVKMTLGNEKYTLIDKEDTEKCKIAYWMLNKRGYVVANFGKPRKHYRLHRYIMNAPKELVIDHINRIKHDNRKENLRICRQIENCQNKINRVNKVAGVSFEKGTQKWFSYIGYKGKKINLGRYNDYNKAVEVRKNAERELFGGLLCI